MASVNLWVLTAIFLAISLSAGMLYAFGVQLNPTQITIIGSLVVVSIIIAIIVKVFNINDIGNWFSKSGISARDMNIAEDTAREFWRRKRGEELDYNESHGLETTFNNQPAYGFTMHRVIRGAIKAGFPVCFVVRPNPMRVVRWNDHPSPEEQDNPFIIWSRGYVGTPVQGLTPSMDAAYFKGSYAERPQNPIVSIHQGDFLRDKNKEESQ